MGLNFGVFFGESTTLNKQTNKPLIWRRTLLSPKFPTREADFSAVLQEWENDVACYAAEFGAERAIADEKP